MFIQSQSHQELEVGCCCKYFVLVDSSASMGRWIGDDGLFQATGVSSDQAGNIYIGQNNRASQSAVMRYTSAGEVDKLPRFRAVPNTCFDRLDTNRGVRKQFKSSFNCSSSK